jgi:mannose-6-phosphate isomerase-like protein (cupin superfamily)
MEATKSEPRAGTAGKPILLAPGEGTTVKNPLGGPTTFKVRGTETGGTLAAFEGVAPPGEGPPLHVHEDADEIWYALEGSFRVRLADRTSDAPAGTFVFIPRGVVHTWQNIGDLPGRLLAIVAPAGLETFFERFAESPPDTSLTDAFRELGAEVGMVVVGPPLSQVEKS